MMPVDDGNTSSARQLKRLRSGGAGGARGIESGLTCGAVGVARVDGDHAHMPAGRAQVLLVNDEGRGNHAVRSERGGGAGWSVRNDQGKVGAAAGLQAGLAGGKTKAAGQDELGEFAHGVDPFNLADVAPVS